MNTETVERTFTIGFSEEADVPVHKVVQGLVGLLVEVDLNDAPAFGGLETRGRIEGVVGRVDDDGIHLWLTSAAVGDLSEPHVVTQWSAVEGVWVL